MQIVHFLILIGVLIFVHEFGHFIWAKIFDIRVERFALGMGPVIKPLSFRKGETEYAICAFPIGGYVKMFGMQPEELYDERGMMVPEHVAERAFVRKPIWQRAIVVLAGPAMNFVYATLESDGAGGMAASFGAQKLALGRELLERNKSIANYAGKEIALTISKDAPLVNLGTIRLLPIEHK